MTNIYVGNLSCEIPAAADGPVVAAVVDAAKVRVGNY